MAGIAHAPVTSLQTAPIQTSSLMEQSLSNGVVTRAKIAHPNLLCLLRVKNGHILPTGQWYAPSVFINDAWYCMVLHYIAWYCIVLYGIAWYCMVLHGIAWYCMVLHGNTLYCMVAHGIA